jgi:FAD-dependent urate hydroxylase
VSNMRYDAVVVGAGPYGLSVAAHLLGRGLRVGIFGRTLELWRRHMPQGMFLRSHWWATELSDPQQQHGFRRFLLESGRRAGYPIPRDEFVEYGLWFQRHVVPDVDETYVSAIEGREHDFRLTVADGRVVYSAAVVMATGLQAYAWRPALFAHLRPAVVSHTSDHHDFSCFNGRGVIVVGGGQSAIESAALLHEAGARVHVVARRPVAWRDPDRDGMRSVFERMKAPRAAIAPGWDNWILDHAPYAFYRLPQSLKERYNSNYSSGASDWLKHRILGRVTLHEARTIVHAGAGNQGGASGIAAVLSDGTRLAADHMILGTGYRVDVTKLTMLHPSLVARIGVHRSVPLLNHWFESTVPGLYFVGLTALAAYGPLYRFVAGCQAAARRVAGAISAPLPHCRRLAVDRTLRSFAR